MLGADTLLNLVNVALLAWHRSLHVPKDEVTIPYMLTLLVPVWSVDVSAFILSRALGAAVCFGRRDHARLPAALDQRRRHPLSDAQIMRVHILGICGTFMGGIAAIAKAAGHEVSGSDQNVYPPMSTQLERLGIALEQGYDQRHVDPDLDCVVVGNALSRGKPVVEALLDSGLPYYSGPQWLADNVLRDNWVLAVSGTHGKTTTTSMLAWILEYAGLDPGFLIGGIPRNFDVSARLGGAKYFVVEADEYDTAFFDKRAKFVHYRPRTLVINNIEYDHADIYADVDAITLAIPPARADGAGQRLDRRERP